MRRYAGTLKPVLVAREVFFFNAAIWVLFAVASYLRLSTVEARLSAAVVSVLMLGNAAAMLLAGLLIDHRTQVIFYSALLLLVANILLTVTDQVGAADIITLLIDLALLGLLLARRADFLPARAAGNPSPGPRA